MKKLTLSAIGQVARTSRYGTRAITPGTYPFPVGFNVSTDNYYNSAGLFANRLYGASAISTITNYTALGYPKAGFSCTYNIISETVYKYWSHKPGTYVVRGTGTGATVTTSGAGITTDIFATTNGVPFRRTVTVIALTAPTGDAAVTVSRTTHLSVNVSAAGVADMVDLWVGHIDDESKFGGTAPADYFTAEGLATYTHPTHGPLRMMQFQNMVQSWVQDVGDIPADLMVAIPNAYVANTNGTKGSFTNRLSSPEMMARLCIATGMELWPCAFVQMTDAAMTSFATRMASVYTSGKIYGEVGNEPWNGAYFAINGGYLGTQYGATGQPGAGYGLLTDGSGTAIQQALGHASLRWWKVLDTVFGSSRVEKLINVQLVNPSASLPAMDYVDPGIRNTGVKVGNQMDAWSPATYPIICPDVLSFDSSNTGRGITGPTFGGGIGIARGYMTKNKMWVNQTLNGNNANLWLEKAWKNSIDNWVKYMNSWLTSLTSRGYPTKGIEYEGHWNHDDLPLYTAGSGGPAAQNGMIVAYDATTGAMTATTGTINGTSFPTDVLTDWFEDGDIIEATWAGSGGVSDSRTYQCKFIGGALYAFATAAAYATGTTATCVTGGSNKNFLLSNITRMDSFTDWVGNGFQANFSNDGTGVSVISYMHERYYTVGGQRVTATFTPVSNSLYPFSFSNVSKGGQPWAMKNNGVYEPDSPALVALKAQI